MAGGRSSRLWRHHKKNERCRAADQCRPWPLVQKILTLPTDKYLGTKTPKLPHRYPVSHLTQELTSLFTMKRAPKISSSPFFCIRQKFSLSDVAAKSAADQTSEARVAPDRTISSSHNRSPSRINQHSNPSCPSTLVSTASAASAGKFHNTYIYPARKLQSAVATIASVQLSTCNCERQCWIPASSPTPSLVHGKLSMGNYDIG